MFFEIAFLVIAASFSVAGSLTFWPVKSGYDFYIPIVLLIAGYVVGLALGWTFIWLSTLSIDKKKDYPAPNKFSRWMLNQALYYIDIHAGIKCRPTGVNKVPRNTKFLLVCNHRSNFDSMIICAYLKNIYLAFIAKPSLFKIPLGGYHMKRLCYLAIDRQDNLQSLEVMKKAQSYIENDITSIGVFPEGTRQQKDVIGQFHEGAFNIAIRSKCPIVVCSLKNTDKVHKNFPFKSTKVYLNFIETIFADEYEGKTAKQLSDEVNQLIRDDLS